MRRRERKKGRLGKEMHVNKVNEELESAWAPAETRVWWVEDAAASHTDKETRTPSHFQHSSLRQTDAASGGRRQNNRSKPVNEKTHSK